MKAIGIEIDKSRVIFYAAQLEKDGSITNLTGDFKTLTLSDELNSSQVIEFKDTLHSFLDNINPDKIAVVSLLRKGRFTSAPISFKIEGMIQCYKKKEIEFTSSATLTAFYKKNPFNITTEFSYQITAAKLAMYIISKK